MVIARLVEFCSNRDYLANTILCLWKLCMRESKASKHERYNVTWAKELAPRGWWTISNARPVGERQGACPPDGPNKSELIRRSRTSDPTLQPISQEQSSKQKSDAVRVQSSCGGPGAAKSEKHVDKFSERRRGISEKSSDDARHGRTHTSYYTMIEIRDSR
ncbi:unnamed protein product [Trichogramma brassicae]|uniref:Uncharacterized protein n=1 Tax=Trichogramma brassicae TaxID=86971 RepID=A0A6H5J2Z8_9HYME|nr:unnamed protein product [Trichogramma brassicae]